MTRMLKVYRLWSPWMTNWVVVFEATTSGLKPTFGRSDGANVCPTVTTDPLNEKLPTCVTVSTCKVSPSWSAALMYWPKLIVCQASTPMSKLISSRGVGDLDGDVDGDVDGSTVGDFDGDVEGCLDGDVDGVLDGDNDGSTEGEVDGPTVGFVLGAKDGLTDGSSEGDTVG